MRVVSGGSTITMQLARIAWKLPRNLWGKVLQAGLATWLELRMSKREILEAYLNLAPYGREVVGIEEASRAFLGKPVAHLTLGEAAALASLPRSPALYDPYRFEERLRVRRRHVLGLMVGRGAMDRSRARRAAAEPLYLQPPGRSFRAPHLVEVARAEAARAGVLEHAARIRTTLDPAVQAAALHACGRVPRELGDRNVSGCAVVALRASTSELLAVVGSARWDDEEHGGQVNGALALRQPGSTLKPFVYGLAFEEGLTPASLLFDVESHFATPQGDFVPRNYDDRHHGPVRAREALANSYNIPAVLLAERLGPDAVLGRLRALGFWTLDQDATHYGVGLALGDGEVRLLDLAAAYAAIARGGTLLGPTALREVRDPRGRPLSLPRREARRVMSPEIAYLLTDILSDREARLGAFGDSSALDLPFPVSVKTGTSKGYRDNWTVGFAGDVVVAVWVGNFDGSEMHGVSGVTGAAPVFRAVMTSAFGDQAPGRLPSPPGGITTARVCPLSGALPGPSCPRTITERFLAGTEPRDTCPLHETVAIDRRNGLRAGSGCRSDHTVLRRFAHLPAGLERWAAGRLWPLPPDRYSPFCPGPDTTRAASVTLTFPLSGDRFVIDRSRPRAHQAVPLRARVQGADRVIFLVDGRPVAEVGAPFEATWLPTHGEHQLTARTGTASVSIPVLVE